MKIIRIYKEEIKPSLIIDKVIVYVENPKQVDLARMLGTKSTYKV